MEILVDLHILKTPESENHVLVVDLCKCMLVCYRHNSKTNYNRNSIFGILHFYNAQMLRETIYEDRTVKFINDVEHNQNWSNTLKKKNSVTAIQNLDCGCRKKQLHVFPINSSFLCRRVSESSTQIQDRYPRLQLADLFKIPL